MANTLRPAIFLPNDPTAPRICPELAKEIGLNESMVLLQIEFWIRLSGTIQNDGRYWIYESLTDFQDVFPFWSRPTINRAINSLVDKKLLHVGNFNKYKYDKTRWFALNAEELGKLESLHVVGQWVFQNETGIDQNVTSMLQNETTLLRNETGIDQNVTRSAQNVTTIPDLSSDLSSDLSADGSRGEGDQRPTTTDRHPAVKIYEDVACVPLGNMVQLQMITSTVGTDPELLLLWERVIRGGLSLNWKPTNVNWMIDHFRRQEIPGANGGQRRPTGPPSNVQSINNALRAVGVEV